MEYFIGASLSDPHTYTDSGAVVHTQRTMAKSGIATHYCSVGMVDHVQTSLDTISNSIFGTNS